MNLDAFIRLVWIWFLARRIPPVALESHQPAYTHSMSEFRATIYKHILAHTHIYIYIQSEKGVILSSGGTFALGAPFVEHILHIWYIYCAQKYLQCQIISYVMVWFGDQLYKFGSKLCLKIQLI